MRCEMTLDELKKKANELLKKCEKCCKKDHQIDIGGNSYNAFEALGGIKYLTKLINETSEAVGN